MMDKSTASPLQSHHLKARYPSEIHPFRLCLSQQAP
jgi:hypothetical protein